MKPLKVKRIFSESFKNSRKIIKHSLTKMKYLQDFSRTMEIFEVPANWKKNVLEVSSETLEGPFQVNGNFRGTRPRHEGPWMLYMSSNALQGCSRELRRSRLSLCRNIEQMNVSLENMITYS